MKKGLDEAGIKKIKLKSDEACVFNHKVWTDETDVRYDKRVAGSCGVGKLHRP